MGRKRNIFFNGLRDGLPVAMGYLAVAFTLGSSAAAIGLSPFEASLMSALNNTSAGEFSAFTLIAARTAAAGPGTGPPPLRSRGPRLCFFAGGGLGILYANPPCRVCNLCGM